MAIAMHRFAGKALIDSPVADLVLDTTKLDPTRSTKQIVFRQGRTNVNWKYDPKNQIEVIGFNDVPMQDWDFPDSIHQAQAITINDLGDVYPRLKDYADRNNQAWRLYATPGGVRAFNLTDARMPRSPASENFFDFTTTGADYQRQLNSDPLYGRFSRDQNRWNSRISGKPTRDADFVAYPLGTVGRGLPDPRNIDLVHRFHDVPIMENRYVSGMAPNAVPEQAAQDIVNRHLTKVPRSFAAPVERRFERLGLI